MSHDQSHSQAPQPAASMSPGRKAPITPEMLANARDEALKKISYRIREKGAGADATASLSALGIARQPKKPKHHRKRGIEHTVWEHDRPSPASELPQVPDVTSDGPATETPDSTEQIVLSRRGIDTFRSGSKAHTVPTKTGSKSALTPNLEANQRGNDSVPAETRPKKSKNPRWISNADLKPIKVELDNVSNAWGSEIPSDASQGPGDSVQALHLGKLIHKGPEEIAQPLTGWDGKIQPPPVDWNDRPRFNNNNPEFKDAFHRWTNDTKEMTTADDVYRPPIGSEALSNMDMHADGIFLVERTHIINGQTAEKYGYEDDVTDIVKYSNAVTEQDFEDWGKLDLSKQENLAFQNETTDDLVNNWMANTEKRRKLAEVQAQTQQKAKLAAQEYKAVPNPNRPVLNIYIRPALEVDVKQMLGIYNWYIKNSARPTEMNIIDSDEMMYRLSDSQSNKLPIIVAVMKSTASASRIDRTAEIEAWEANPHPIKNINPASGVMKSHEKVVGWASASDFTASDFVERIAAEMELYVTPTHRQMGVGRCLMDKMLEVLDRGWIKRGGYDFHCAEELRPAYTSGGTRDIHKIVLTLRKWKQPRNFHGHVIRSTGKESVDLPKLHDRENDYDVWLKEWLESWGFQVEGVLSGVGAKNGRFLDTVFLGRETAWQPADGRIPDPLPGTF